MELKPGRASPPKKEPIVHVVDAECRKGGLHNLTNREEGDFLVTYCTKCRRTSPSIDAELNGEKR